MPETLAQSATKNELMPQFSAAEFKDRLAAEFKIDGVSPAERAEQLKNMSPEGVAILLEDINMNLQREPNSQMNHEQTMKIGEQATIAPEDRHEIFTKLINDIKNTPSTINPARLADALAMGTILLHPFKDGNGRTARAIGLLLRDAYDSPEYADDFDIVTASRDQLREQGGYLIFSYTPRFREGFDQSDPKQVSDYLSGLLHRDGTSDYYSCYSHSPEPFDTPI